MASITMSSKMPSKDFVRRHLDVAENYSTIYMYACYGFQVTTATIKAKARQNLNGWYTPAHIAELEKVANRIPPVWGFDCVNLTKGILWGWIGDPNDIYGGARYCTNGVPDTNANGMIGKCTDVSTDFTTIEPGEGLWLEGHWGVYVGGGLAVECTGRWANGVQVTAVLNVAKNDNYHGRYWTKHGKLPWVAYDGKADKVKPVKIELGDRTIKKGTKGDDVRELQRTLLKLGYDLPKYGADGECGSETVKAIKQFQRDNGLEADGVFGRDSYGVLRQKAFDQWAPENPAQKLCSAYIPSITRADAETLKSHWPNTVVTEL